MPESASAFVRAARTEDIPAVVHIQVAGWRTDFAAMLPDPVLAELTGEEAAEQFGRQWREAVSSPPSSRHRLLVATQDRAVVGFTAIGPAQDPDRWPGTDAEIYALHVDPEHARHGHGSRLLNAAVDHLVDDRFGAVYAWVPDTETALGTFLQASGWRPDGARRELNVGEAVPMVRLHAAIGD